MNIADGEDLVDDADCFTQDCMCTPACCVYTYAIDVWSDNGTLTVMRGVTAVHHNIYIYTQQYVHTQA